MTSPPRNVGILIRQRREIARLSQMALALEVGVSTRHLGFVELGRSGPSPRLLLRIAERLDVPLRERNEWLLAAGYAPNYPETALDEQNLRQVRAILQRMIDAQDPYPAVGVDRCWNVQLTNTAAKRLTETLPAHVLEPVPNLFRIALHPDGLARHSDNFGDWSPYLLRNLDRIALRTGDGDVARLAEEVETWPRILPRAQWQAPPPRGGQQPILFWHTRIRDHDLALFTVMSMLGTPLDVTLDELTIEMFFPADPATDRVLQELARQDLAEE